MTAREVEGVARQLATQGAPWAPEYHSPAQAQAARRHFDELTEFDKKGRALGFKRPLTPTEQEWIRNERLLSKLDFNYFATRYAFLRHWNTGLCLFEPNLPQRIKLAVYARQEERGIAILTLNLKARQHGSSTLDELICGHRATFWPQTYAIVGSSDPEKSRLMFNMVELMWEHLPWWLKPEVTSYSAGERVVFGRLNSIISIQHGTQETGIGQGHTPSLFHLSEVADFDNAEELIDAGLMRAFHHHRHAFGVLECTGTGRGTWWHRKYESCLKDGDLAQFTPTFLPWFLGTDKYPAPDWLRRYPIPAGWRPAEQTEAHAEMCRRYVESTPILREFLGEGWELPREQRWFYEIDRARSAREGSLGLFLRMMPATPEEAFASVNETIFSIDLMDSHRSRVRAPRALRLSGPDIPDRILPQPPAGRRPGRTGTVAWVPGDARPLRWSLEDFGPAPGDSFNPMGWLLAWEEPRAGEEYAMGVDCSEGIGEDRTVISLVRRGAVGEPDEQVAEWSHDRASGLDAWSVALAIAAWYEGDGSSVTVVPELSKDGPSLVNEMRKRGWRRWHKRRSWTRAGGSTPTGAVGWLTTATSRPVLLGHLIRAVRDEWIVIRNKWLLGELEDLEDQEGKVKARAGAHDDRVLACAMATLELWETMRKGEATPRQRNRREEFEELTREPEWCPPAAALPTPSGSLLGMIGEEGW